MNIQQWHQVNDRYIAASVKWIRLSLGAQIKRLQASHLEDASSGIEEGKNAKNYSNGKSNENRIGQSVENDPETALKEAALAMTAAAALKPPPAMMLLREQLRLSDFECQVLLLCIAMEFDTQIPVLCGQAQDDPRRPFPTFALAMSLFDTAHWDALSPQGPLRFWRLIEIATNGSQPLTASPLCADERIVNYLKGLNQLDERLSTLVDLIVPINESLPASQHRQVIDLIAPLQVSNGKEYKGTVQLIGPDEHSKRTIAGQAAALLGKLLYRLPISMLPAQPKELDELVRLWHRETLLLPLILYVDAGFDTTEGHLPILRRFLERCPGFCFVSIREAESSLAENTLSVDIRKPTPDEQKSAWQNALTEANNVRPEVLAAQFNLNISVIRNVTEGVLGHPEGDIQHRLWHACLARSRPNLDHLAQNIDTKSTWDDIVLPAEEMTLLRQIASQVRDRMRVYDEWGFRNKMNRGLGITALFAGESGTGKTMAAEVIANHLDLNLYRIDLSAVVSKYIGETEKNLRRLFDAAEDGGAILFFDEADALFGKRSEVKDSHDRYANIEINYLLQRMEAYRGLAILATNMKTAMDQAFMRRLRFVVNFSFPDINLRKAIWAKVFPENLPKALLDLQSLAKLSVTGGTIHNIAINAAFLAAESDSDVTMPLILAAARTEYRKMGRPVNETEFKWQPQQRGAS